MSNRTSVGHAGQFFIEWDSLVHCRLSSILGLNPRRALPVCDTHKHPHFLSPCRGSGSASPRNSCTSLALLLWSQGAPGGVSGQWALPAGFRWVPLGPKVQSWIEPFFPEKPREGLSCPHGSILQQETLSNQPYGWREDWTGNSMAVVPTPEIIVETPSWASYLMISNQISSQKEHTAIHIPAASPWVCVQTDTWQDVKTGLSTRWPLEL